MSTTTTDSGIDRATTLRKIRATVRPRPDRIRENGVGQNGIFLVHRFRIEDSARRLAQLVESLDGVAIVQKTHKARHTGDLTWRVDFTIDLPGDYYVEKGKPWPGTQSI